MGEQPAMASIPEWQCRLWVQNLIIEREMMWDGLWMIDRVTLRGPVTAGKTAQIEAGQPCVGPGYVCGESRQGSQVR